MDIRDGDKGISERGGRERKFVLNRIWVRVVKV